MTKTANKFRNSRGYTAHVRAVCEGRVLYDVRDADGSSLLTNGCVSANFFFANWREV